MQKNEESNMILSIKRSVKGSLVKIQAVVLGSWRLPVGIPRYKVGYIRSKNFRGWVCTCEDFFNRRIALNRNCKHIKLVRSQYGRYGQKVPL